MPIMTMTTRTVLAILLREPDRPIFGRQICRATGLGPGTVYQILLRFEGLSWLTSEWENAASHGQGGPPRKYYKLTPYGATQVRADLDKVAFRIKDQATFRFDDVSEIEMSEESLHDAASRSPGSPPLC
jgi:PadR family transcriptional regulator, regulatory protein PadR